MTTVAQRKAKERKAKRAAGLVPMEVWVPHEIKQTVRDMVQEQIEAHMLRQLWQEANT